MAAATTDDAQAPGEQPRREVRELTGGSLLAVKILGAIARLWCATLRIQPTEEALQILADPRPTVFVLWHNRLFAIGEVHRRFRRPHVKHPISGLISASRDGAWLVGFFERLGIRAIRGSSSWRGAQAIRESLKALDHGDLGITPDGPRGPCYDLKPGAALVARKTDSPVALLSLNFTQAKRLDSWDRFYLPLPFSRVTLQGKAVKIGGSETPADTAKLLRENLIAMTEDRQGLA